METSQAQFNMLSAKEDFPIRVGGGGARLRISDVNKEEKIFLWMC